MAAIFAFHGSKAVLQVPAIEVTANDLLQIGPPECRTIVLFVKEKIRCRQQNEDVKQEGCRSF